MGAVASAAPLDDAQLGCVLEPSQDIELSSPIEGVVGQVLAERGDTVRAGQVVVRLVSAAEQAALDVARERAAFAARKVERNEELLRQGLLADFERDELLTEQMLANLAEKEARVRLEQKSIRSPIAGLVAERYLSPGEYVGSDPLLRLVALDPLYAEVIMRGGAYGQVSEGTRVQLTVEGGGPGVAERYEGEVIIVDRVIDAASTTFGLRVSLRNPGPKLPSGLKCRVVFPDLEQR